MAQERLQKILARAGVASRRAAEEIVLAGRVRVNGKVVDVLGATANPMDDKIELDGRRILAETATYIVFHKPRGIVTTLSDPEGRPTVADYVKDLPARVFPVGRLDFATSGVLLLTNDGDFSNGLLHPKKAVAKTYVVKVQGVMDDGDIDRWRKGVKLEDGTVTRPAELMVLRHETDKTWFELTIHEGKNQQIRRMGEATGFRVMRLARVAFAGITAEGLRPGMWRLLTREELQAMKKELGVPKRIPSGDALARMAVKATTVKVAKAFDRGASVEGGVNEPHRRRGPEKPAPRDDAREERGPRARGPRGPARSEGPAVERREKRARLPRADQPSEAPRGAKPAARGSRGRGPEEAVAPAAPTKARRGAARVERVIEKRRSPRRG
jgi:23S rRNA pseudouridine2605 synthase